MIFNILKNNFIHEYESKKVVQSVLSNEKGEPILRSDLLPLVENEVIDFLTEFTEDVKQLPEIGEPCEEGVLYLWSNEMQSMTIKCRQSHNRTHYEISDIPALFSFYRENTDELEWIPNEEVELGWKRMYEGVQYEVIQAHMTLETWTPPATPALWNAVIEEPVGSEWTVGVAYTIGDVVTYQGAEYECRQSHTSQAGWTPSAVLSLWLPL